jgi:predicted nucleotidyltransferase
LTKRRKPTASSGDRPPESSASGPSKSSGERRGALIEFSKDFAELLASLNERGVRALIVGGYAFSYHARPRNTKDIDVWIEPTPENVARLLSALDDFGFGDIGLKAEDFLEPGQFVQLGYPPNRVDLLTSIKGVSFEEAWAGRVEDVVSGVRVRFLGEADLIRNKKAVGRPQDQADVAILESFRNPRK